MILKTLVDTYGVLPPELVETVTPANRRHPPGRRRPARRATRDAAGATDHTGPAPVVVRPHRPTHDPVTYRSTRQSEMADQIRVLIVDDIPETRDHLTKLLGFESDIDVVGAAASGREALEMAGKLTPDIVLMDINMPDMDGIAATEQMAATLPPRPW